MYLDQTLIDDILITIGELNAERSHRKESEYQVSVSIVGCSGYSLIWHTGNKLDIMVKDEKLGTINLTQFNAWNRYTAVAIAGIIVAHSEMWKRLNGG